jgi:hypothetical protein
MSGALSSGSSACRTFNQRNREFPRISRIAPDAPASLGGSFSGTNGISSDARKPFLSFLGMDSARH